MSYRDRVTVATITSRVRRLDAEVALDESDGLYHGCVVNLDTLGAIPRAYLTERVTQLGGIKMLAIERAIHRALGMSIPCPFA
jgi:mRNA-degrading endonuclease toxin of MazEF toxin-antitoxin module